MQNNIGNQEILKFGPDKTSRRINPKEGSNSDIQFHSEISVLDSNRPIVMSQLIKPVAQVKKEVSGRALRFNSNQQKSKEEQPKEQQINRQTSNQISLKKIQKKFKELLYDQAYIWRKDIYYQQKEIFQKLFSFDSNINQKENTQDLVNYNNNSSCLNIKIKVFQPSQQFTKIWDLLAIFTTAYMLWLTNFAATFSLFTDTFYEYLIYFLLIYIVIDTLIICNKAIIIQGELILNRKLIIKQYLKLHVYSDAIIFLIWIIQLFQIQELHIRQLLSLFQTLFIIFKLYNRLNNYTDYLYMGGNLSEIIDLIILISCVFFCVHIFACYWTYIAFATEYLDNNWLIKYNIQSQGYWVQYNEAIYWATMTMVTVGYGDVTAANQYEILFSNFTMFISSLVFAYSMNSIGIIIKNISVQQHHFKKKLILMNSYMNNNLVSEQIQNRVRNYLKYQSTYDQQINQSEIYKIIDNLPSTLQDELKQNIKLRIISNIKLFSNFSKKTQYQAAKYLEMIQFIPNDIIFDDIMKKDNSIYFIEKGEVIFTESKTKKQIQVFKQGDIFNQYTFFTNFNIPITALSTKYTEVYKMSRKNFLDILSQNTKDNDIFHHIKDQIIFNQDNSLIDLKCNICGKSNHLIIYCPVINFKPNLEKLIKSENFLFQERKKISRIDRQKINSLADYINIQSSVTQYQQYQFPQSFIMNNEKPSQYDVETHTKEAKLVQNIQPSLSQLPQLQEKIHNAQEKQTQFLQSQQLSMSSQLFKQVQKQVIQQIAAQPLNNESKKSYNNLDDNPQLRKQIFLTKPYKSTQQTTMELSDVNFQFHFCDIDQVMKSQIYMPQHYQAAVIAQANQKRKNNKKQKLSYKYTIYFKIARLFSNQGIRKQQSNNIPQSNKMNKFKQQFK